MNQERRTDRLGPAAGTLLPRGPFRRVSDGAEIDLRAGRGPLLLLLMHSSDCEQCRTSLGTLLEQQAEFADWGARVLGVAPAPRQRLDPCARTGASEENLLIDTRHVLGDGTARLIVADEWGEIHFVDAVGTGHEMPVQELLEWARFVAIQCPECEGPEGEWRSNHVDMATGEAES